MVYLLHFSKPGASPVHHAGRTINRDKRLDEEFNISDIARSTFTRRMATQGYDMAIAYLVPGDREVFNRVLKHRSHIKDFCPLCQDNAPFIQALDINKTPAKA